MNNTISLMGVLAVGAGAAIGAWARWGLGIVLNALLTNLPLGTLIAKLSGGFLIGITIGLVGTGTFEHPNLRLLITTGFLGGLTTFSAFTGESLLLLQKQEYAWAVVHTSSHVLGALFMAAVGYSMLQYLRG